MSEAPEAPRQRSLFHTNFPSYVKSKGPEVPCDITAIEKRRDGGTRYWCRAHHADATAKYGKPALVCRSSNIEAIRSNEVLDLDIGEYRGGIALWGAVPAVYDTTRLQMDRGIHVHARRAMNASKELDVTFRAVRLVGGDLPEDGIFINEIDAIYYMVSSVFGFTTTYVTCKYCGWPHLDKDFFSVTPHRRHLCAGCGRHFHDAVTGIGNPIVGAREACGLPKHTTGPAKRPLDIRQSDFPGGLQVWGSNDAFLWTCKKSEEQGIHVHAYKSNKDEPEIDDTFSRVVVDGIELNDEMVRKLMAQNVMPSLNGRIQSIDCPKCGNPQFDDGQASYTPSVTHTCTRCKVEFASPGRRKKMVANPLPRILEHLAETAPRAPQLNRLELLPETLKSH